MSKQGKDVARQRTALKSLRFAYLENDWDAIGSAASDLLKWIEEWPGGPVEMTKPQLTALLVMARGYSRNKVVEHADWTNPKRP